MPRYVRCIKPNSAASPSPDQFDENLVKLQLRASSILEAVRIRKIGYGYRMSYDDFADQFWPIVAGRIYEPDNQTIELVFNKAAELNEPETAKLLAVGEGQGWRCGVTKLFIKDEVRFAMEATLNKVRQNKATLVQAAIRRKIAKRIYQTRLNARTKV